MEELANRSFGDLSGGQRQRVLIARALVQQAKLLLLDEPFTGLDQRAKKWLEEHLASFKTAGGAIIMTTHSFGRELAVADRIAILAGGAIALDTARGTLSADDVHRLYTLHAEDAP
jgi:manganese/iron transport system ATP-binding protein